MFGVGTNYDTDTSNPHYRTLNPLTALTFQYRFSDGSNGVTGTNIDPDNIVTPIVSSFGDACTTGLLALFGTFFYDSSR